MINKCKLFIFDLDGVITDTAEYHYLAWKKLTDELGYKFSIHDNERLKGVSRIHSLEIILDINNSTEKYSKQEKIRLANKKNDYYLELLKNITPKDLLPGIEDLLDKLKKYNIKTAIASASKNAFTVINYLGINDKFDYIVNANEIKNSKPAPDVFLKAAEVLEVNNQNCICIEDASAGIKAIKAAGMYAVGIGNIQNFKEADVIFSSTNELNLEKILLDFNK
jgi:beta-phosphoglucomutase